MAVPKFVTGAEAAALVKNGDTIAVSGFIGAGCADEILYNIEKRFLETGEPKDLTLSWGASISDFKPADTEGCEKTSGRGCNRFAHPGFIKRLIAGHINGQVDIVKMIAENQIEAYNLPQGVLIHMFRAKGGKKPCIVTPVGVGTFVDPRVDGGKLNAKAKENGPNIVEVIEIDGEDYLMYKTFNVDVAIVRGTTADERGNITVEKEGIICEINPIALAARASGGIVIAQVERVVKAGTLNPQDVRLPGVSVDYIVVASDPKYHMQTWDAPYDGSLSGEYKVPVNEIAPIKLDERKVIARRGAMELIPGAVLNLGIGIPAAIGNVAAEEGLGSELTMTVEPGPIGGVACDGSKFGCSINAEAMMEHPLQFDMYDSGSLDLAVLGLAELDEEGNVNVSMFGPKVAGAGGFINITQNTKNVIFVGAMTAGGLKVKASDGKLEILQEGKVKKFIKKVGHKTFSGSIAVKRGQKIMYITERCVFEMRPEGLTLTEIAPGIDLQTQILDQMEFTPVISKDLKTMDARIFTDKPMGIFDEVMAKKK